MNKSAKNILSSLVLTAALAQAGKDASAQSLFSANFETDTTANWTVNKATADNFADFFFDYSTVGIPAAPHSVAGTTRGLKLQANPSAGVFSGLSVSPTGQHFTGSYTVRFDLWMNYNGPLPAGGNGSTQVTSYGLGTGGTTAQWAGGTQDSVWFGATGDGGSSVDYRAYSPAYPTGAVPTNGVFTAGTSTSPDARNNTHPYYAQFGGATAPAAQLTLFPEQTGATGAGAAGMAWRDVVITKEGSVVKWWIDGLSLAGVDISGLSLMDNIFFGQFDINATSSSGVDAMIFGLIDNVQVTAVPEPSAIALALLGIGSFLVLRRRK
jgi:hypothetical protein